MRIAISGRSGCGNTTVSRLLAERLGLKLVNYTFRSIAKEDGISFAEVCRRAEKDDRYDIKVDLNQVSLAKAESSVLGSRLAIWMLEDANLKVYLNGSLEVRAKRIHKREGGTLKKQQKMTSDRDKRDHNRYVKLYKIDTNDYSLADLVINTDLFDALQVADIIETAVQTLSL